MSTVKKLVFCKVAIVVASYCSHGNSLVNDVHVNDKETQNKRTELGSTNQIQVV